MDALSAASGRNTISFPDIEISEDLVRRFDASGPRYTSYPTADCFHSEFTERTYISHLARRAKNCANAPLSVYVHLPFCESLCDFCACNKIITHDHSRSVKYLKYLDIATER
ncbi:hypothetical protein [Allopusillimonas ginsengisoli]|uniref:hypothetical protein n=1 Tax=Allopusillimonas ginsengisoli TaxID=453575 RepID=UPI001ADAA592